MPNLNHPTAIAELTTPIGIGSGVLLGCLFVAYICFFVACFKALMIFGTIIYDHYEDLDDREKRQSNGKNVKPDSVAHQSVGLFRQLIRYQIRIFGKANIEGDSGQIKKLVIMLRGNIFMNKLLNLSCRGIGKKFLNFWVIRIILKFACFFKCHKSSDVAKRPNEKS
jgi:hypothetical protein